MCVTSNWRTKACLLAMYFWVLFFLCVSPCFDMLKTNVLSIRGTPYPAHAVGEWARASLFRYQSFFTPSHRQPYKNRSICGPLPPGNDQSPCVETKGIFSKKSNPNLIWRALKLIGNIFLLLRWRWDGALKMLGETVNLANFRFSQFHLAHISSIFLIKHFW